MRSKTAVPRAQVEALIEAFAKRYWAAKLGAPLKTEQRFYSTYMKKLNAMEARYPHIDFSSESFQREMEERAHRWRQKHPLFGPAAGW